MDTKIITLKMPISPVAETDEERKAAWAEIHNAFLVYRTVARKAAAILDMAEIAGANVDHKGDEWKVIPKYDDRWEILKATFGKDTKGLGPIRPLIKAELDDKLSSEFVDGILRELDARWKAKDAEFPKARRNFLVLNGRRLPPRFQFVQLPIRVRQMEIDENGHGITIRYKPDGGRMRLKIGTVDRFRWERWKDAIDTPSVLRDSRLKIDKDGKMWLLACIQVGCRTKRICPGRKLIVTYGEWVSPAAKKMPPSPALLLTVEDKSGSETINGLFTAGATDGLLANKVRSQRSKVMCSSAHLAPSILEGFRRRQANITAQRSNFTHTWNHVWSKRIVRCAIQNECETIEFDLPEKLDGEPWPWAEFKLMTTHKLERG